MGRKDQGPGGDRGHLVEHGVDLRHDVFAVHNDGLPLGRAQSDVQNSPLLRDVDLFTPEQGIDASPLARFLRQL